MYNTQTIEILKKLDKDELKRFGDFLKSPFFNNSSFIVKIYAYVKKEYPAFTGSTLEPENIFKKLYPSESFKDTRIRNLYAEFGNLLKKFLAHLRFENSELELETFVANSLADKNLGQISNKVINKRLEEYKEKVFWDENQFETMYLLYSLYLENLAAASKHSTREYFSIQVKLQELIIALFFREIFHLLATQSAQKIVFRTDEAKAIIEDFIDVIDTNKLFNYLENGKNPYTKYLKVHYLMYYYTEYDITEEEYFDLKNKLYEIIYEVSKREAKVFIERLIQIILYRLVSVDRKYHLEIFELSRLFCELKIFPNKKIPFWGAGSFRDMFTTSVILKELDWAESFVKEYSNYLMEDIRENELNYCMGNISFKRKKYDLSLEYFNKVKLFDIIEKINIRFYYMMNCIELKAYENALASLQTLRQFYIDRKDIPEIFASAMPDAIKYFGEIIKCEMDGIKLDPQIYDEAKDGRRYYHTKYVLGKMEMLL